MRDMEIRARSSNFLKRTQLQDTIKSSLVDRIIPECEQLPHQLVGLAAHCVVIHHICDELLDALDLRRGAEGQIKVDIHVVDIGRGVHGDFVLGQLSLVIESWPILGRGQDICNIFDLLEFRVGLEHVLVDLRATHCGVEVSKKRGVDYEEMAAPALVKNLPFLL